jgi:ABC-type transport system substrate-binding protein
VFAFITLLPLAVFLNPVAALVEISSDLNVGPYVDGIIYRVISNQDQRVLALQAGEIEMDTSFFDPVHYNTLDADPTIAIYSASRNGYGHITINCRDWPLNETVLRQAFAYAFDKTRVTSEIMNGFSIEHDSLVPQPNSWCVEDQLVPHYYSAQSEIGNILLNASGLFPFGDDGYRTYRGQPFDIEIEYSAGPMLSGGTAQIGVDALLALHINAQTRAADFNEYIQRLNNHESYDMVFYSTNFYDNDVDWLAYEYWSENADIPFKNPTNFRNATYDACRQQLLYGTTYDEVYNASSWMQKILQEQVPRLVVYENIYLQAYRTDTFTGYVPDLGSYITGPCTMRKLHMRDGTSGGTVSVALGEEPDSFNIYLTTSPYSEIILSEIWPSLYSYGPDFKPWPYLAEHLLVETHTDNPDVPSGLTRYTIDIIQNATWSDSIPLTAHDVAFTFEYILESGVYGNQTTTELGPLVSAYATSDYRVTIEYSMESYWYFKDFAFQKIIPEHIFNNETGIGYSGWSDWNPVYDPSSPNTNCGPFVLSDFEENEFFQLTTNRGFAYAPPFEEPTPPDIIQTSTTTVPVLPISILSIIISAVSVGVIVVMIMKIISNKKNGSTLGPSLS